MSKLQISITPLAGGDGPDYERAAFGLLEIVADGKALTHGFRTDADGSSYARGPYVPGYYLAEWLAWNWWRLRWEPRPQQRPYPLQWRLAHQLSAIGEGYLWPNITVASDGFRCRVTAAESQERNARPFEYLGAPPVTVPATEFEQAMDDFIGRILQSLADAGVSDTDLQKHWADLKDERGDAELARFRRFEALLGFDPDEADEEYIESRLGDAASIGVNALDELAIGAGAGLMSAPEIVAVTRNAGFDGRVDDALQLPQPMAVSWGAATAWQVGVATANAVRHHAGSGNGPVDNRMLAEWAGLSERVFNSERRTDTLSWLYQTSPQQCRVVVRSPHPTGRRFDVARLIGDRLLNQQDFAVGEFLLPATRSYSYRQQFQRAFAAELLSPWDAVQDALGDDYSDENQEYVAGYFNVSEMTISTHIANHTGIGREHLI